MYIYKDLDKYFDSCINCGDCCKIPGVLLPDQIDILAKHFAIDYKELFEKYLIAELCAPSDTFTPAFVLSPVKVDHHGNRFPHKIFDDFYTNIRNLNCIFRDVSSNQCSIHDIKPFGCALLLCSKMTKAKSIELNKTFYYHKWIKSQDIIFSIYPEIEPIYNQLSETVLKLAQLEADKIQTLDDRNKIINIDIATVFNGKPITGMPIYS